MAQHISVRVPWHDNNWNGSVCNQPVCNSSCLRLANIYENRNDNVENSLCGKCMAGHEAELPCIDESSAFMSPDELVKTTIHPYKKYYSPLHQHFLETEVTYPAYSFVAKPFAWMMKERMETICKDYGIAYDAKKEPILLWNTSWVQEASNQRAIFDYFYGDVLPNESLCIAYVKQVPFIEDSRRVVVAMGHVKNIIPAVEHNHTDEGSLRSMTWETMICHSIREEHKDGFVIPYKEMMEYAEKHPEFDMADITVFAPEDSFEQFSYATEHIEYDTVIDVILSCIKAFEIINNCLDEDYSNVLEWLNYQLAVAVLEQEALNGHTIVPRNLLVNKVNELILEPACHVTTDIIKAIHKFNEPLIMEREMKDGTEYYKLVRIHEYDEIIEKRVKKRLNATPHEINADWRKLFDNYLKDMGVSGEITPKEERARKEKSACLEVLAKSRITKCGRCTGNGSGIFN